MGTLTRKPVKLKKLPPRKETPPPPRVLPLDKDLADEAFGKRKGSK